MEVSLINATTVGAPELTRAVLEYDGAPDSVHDSLRSNLRATHSVPARRWSHVRHCETRLARHYQKPLWQERTSGRNNRG